MRRSNPGLQSCGRQAGHRLCGGAPDYHADPARYLPTHLPLSINGCATAWAMGCGGGTLNCLVFGFTQAVGCSHRLNVFPFYGP